MSSIEISNVDIALYALFRLGGDTAPVHTEDVALKCFHLANERFSWKKYPQYPELDPARFALLDAAKPLYGKLARQVFKKISGKRQSHWVLTPEGLNYVRERLDVLKLLEAGQIVLDSEHTEKNRFVDLLKKHPAFKKFVTTETCEHVEKYEFTDLLHCSLDASPKVLRERLERLRVRAEKSSDQEVKKFLMACESRFVDMLTD
jgi:hypothetical protein